MRSQIFANLKVLLGLRCFRLLLISIFCGGVAQANVQLEVSAGYDGLVPQTRCFPVTCDLTTDGPDLSATLELIGGGITKKTSVNLTAQRHLRILFPSFDSRTEWTARLVDTNQQVIIQAHQKDAKSLPALFPLLAGISATEAGMPVFPPPTANNPNFSCASARLDPSLLLEDPMLMQGIDVFYLNSARAAELNTRQVAALTTWIYGGGHLVIGINQPDDFSPPWLRELSPFTPISTTTLNQHEALQKWIHTAARQAGAAHPTNSISKTKKSSSTISNALPGHVSISRLDDQTPRINPAQDLLGNSEFDRTPLVIATGTIRDGLVLIGDQATPLVIQAQRGRGQVSILTFNVEKEPFLSWNNRSWFWARLAGLPDSIYQEQFVQYKTPQFLFDSYFGGVLDSRQIHKLPLGWLLILLAVYLIVIGPLDRYWLKKINRQMLTWITFPCYVLVFTGLIYLIGFHLRAGELEWDELNVVDILPEKNQTILRGQTYASIYSPANENYLLRGNESFAALRGEDQNEIAESVGENRIALQQTGGNFSAKLSVPVWTSRLVVNDWIQSAPAPIELSVTKAKRGWKVTVVNNMDHALSETAVVLENRIYELGLLQAGERKIISLSRKKGASLEHWIEKQNFHFQSMAETRQRAFGPSSPPVHHLAAAAMALSFSSSVSAPANTDLASVVHDDVALDRFTDSGYAIFFAWDGGHCPVPALNQFQVKRLQRDTLFRLVIPLSL